MCKPWGWSFAKIVGTSAEKIGRIGLQHAFGDTRSQSLDCDGDAHTLVWVSNAPAYLSGVPASSGRLPTTIVGASPHVDSHRLADPVSAYPPPIG